MPKNSFETPYLQLQDYNDSNADHSDPLESIRLLWSNGLYKPPCSRSTAPLVASFNIKYNKEDLIKIARETLDQILKEKNYDESQLILAKCLAAARFTRDKIPNGSKNKGYGNKPDAEIPTKKLAKHGSIAREERYAIWSAIRNDLEHNIFEILINHHKFSLENVERLEETYCKELVDIILSRGNTAVGNCAEYGILVFYVLKFIFKINDVYAVGLDRPGDHIFIIAGGQKPDAQGCFPVEWEEWDPNTLIIDVWIQKNDGVFSVEEYEDAWKYQLEKWEKRGLLIKNSISPTHWLEDINIYPKVLVWDLAKHQLMERPIARYVYLA